MPLVQNQMVFWRTRLLGRVEVTNGDITVSRFESSRCAVLLARLAMYSRRVHPREELAELLWPGSDPGASRQRLRQALFSLRTQLAGPEEFGQVILSDKNGIWINPAHASNDVADFEEALGKEDYGTAKSLYCGELMPGFFDEWVVLERYRLEALAEEIPSDVFIPHVEAKAVHAAARLPKPYTSFVGRDDELALLTKTLTAADAPRLVVVSGVGGAGKTRFTLELGSRLASFFDDTLFLPLASCTHAKELMPALQKVLGVTDASDAESAINLRLENRRALLIFDNFEQLISTGGAEIVQSLLHRFPQLVVLVSSRSALIVGEMLFPLPQLPLEESERLFIDRAKWVRAGFHTTEGNESEIRAVCEALEGNPLCIELAASRLRLLNPKEMSAALDSKLEWLRQPTRSGRQSSLEATLTWSWDLLPIEQQVALAKMGIFEGSWTLAAAKYVCELEHPSQVIGRLLMDSLLEASSDGPITEYAMHSMVREFALTKLNDSQAIRRRHREFYCSNPTTDANMAAAWRNALEDGDAELSYELALALEENWIALIGAESALRLIEDTLSIPAWNPTTRVRTLALAVDLCATSGRNDKAREFALAALTEASTHEERAVALLARARVGLAAYEDEAQVRSWLEECLALSRSTAISATAWRRLGILKLRAKQFSEAEELFQRAYDAYHANGDGRNARYALANQAHVLFDRGEAEGNEELVLRSLQLYETCHEQADRDGDATHLSKILLNEACSLAALSRYDIALEIAKQCIDRCLKLGNARTLAFAMWNVPDYLLHLENHETAVPLMAFGAKFWVEHLSTLGSEDSAYLAKFQNLGVQNLGLPTYEALWAKGEELSLKEAVELIP